MRRKKKLNQKQTGNVYQWLRDRWALIFIGLLFLYIIGVLLRGEARRVLLDSSSQKVKAIVVDEKNFWGNSPVTFDYSYSYEFMAEGEKYREDTRNKELKIGDSLLIEYLPYYPKFSRPLKK
jgi:hypothetical protein